MHCISEKKSAQLSTHQHNQLPIFFPNPNLRFREGVWQFLPLKGGHGGGKRDEGVCCGSFVPLPRRIKRFSRVGSYSKIHEFLPFERLRHLMAEHKKFLFAAGNPICSALGACLSGR